MKGKITIKKINAISDDVKKSKYTIGRQLFLNSLYGKMLPDFLYQSKLQSLKYIIVKIILNIFSELFIQLSSVCIGIAIGLVIYGVAYAENYPYIMTISVCSAILGYLFYNIIMRLIHVD